MPFSKPIKDEAKWKSAHRCCVCHDVFVEVHHIIPEADGGPSTIDNAAPLCAKHHDLFGGNPEKRAAIRAMRDTWWEEIAKIRESRTDFHERDPTYVIPTVQNSESSLLGKLAFIYHMVREKDTFAETAQTLWRLLVHVQRHSPNRPRVLYIDIVGHEGMQVGETKKWMRWDGDMMEFQIDFSRVFLLQFCKRIHLPLWTLENKRAQNNALLPSDELHLFDKSDTTTEDAIAFATAHNAELYIGESDTVITPKKASNSYGVTTRAREQREKAPSNVGKKR